ncbi:hypothetical protein [Nonomuraea sp. NPDC049158]|uniref:hypothetical protein n=1 Tax=Nonomuraea sp. NPDC049158 TaxID=3155649 RepID=UPI0034109524
MEPVRPSRHPLAARQRRTRTIRRHTEVAQAVQAAPHHAVVPSGGAAEAQRAMRDIVDEATSAMLGQDA